MLTSASASAPEPASRPPRTHTAMTMANSGTELETAYGFLKTPEPMTVPITMAVVIQGPSTRGKRWRVSTGAFAESMANSVHKRECDGRVRIPQPRRLGCGRYFIKPTRESSSVRDENEQMPAASARKKSGRIPIIRADRTCIFSCRSYDTLLNRIAFAGVIEFEFDQVTVSASGSQAPVGLGHPNEYPRPVEPGTDCRNGNELKRRV